MSRPFWWFQGKSVEELTEALINAGSSARLEVHLDGQDMTLHVVPLIALEGGGGGGINDSHVCPPQCP